MVVIYDESTVKESLGIEYFKVVYSLSDNRISI
jgi:hypothetical protein